MSGKKADSISALFEQRRPRSTGLFPQASSRFSKENNIKQNGASRTQTKLNKKTDSRLQARLMVD
jgi:hypothetical protein